MTSRDGSRPLGVGIVGFQAGRSWSARAHVPAIRALPGFRLAAVATSRAETARAAADTLGIAHGYHDHRALASDPEVDLVVVTVKVPHHREIVLDALDAGKAVYCEWPLGNGLEEAVEMRERSRAVGARSFVGLQARLAPVIRYAQDLVQGGYVGEVLSTTMIGAGVNWTDRMNLASQYLADARNGATLMTIPFGHAVDALCMVLGEFAEVSGRAIVRQPCVTLVETGETFLKTAADQVAVLGVLEGGALATIAYRAGRSAGSNFLWEVHGAEGTLRITAEAGHPQMLDLSLSGAQGPDAELQPLVPSASYRLAPPTLDGRAANVAELYLRIASDLATGAATAPTFDDAVRRHRLLNRLEESIRTGESTPA